TRHQLCQLLDGRIAARDRVAAQFTDRDDQVVEKTTIPRGDCAAVTLQCDLVLFLAPDVPFLGRDLRMLAHAHAGGAIADARDVELDVAKLQARNVIDLLAGCARLREPAHPVGEGLAETELNPAQALDAAHECEVAIDAI